MCIVVATTAHPSYALIILDNRDEFILRPTSRPHWWTSSTSTQQILSARDLQRAEQGTWLGITRTGNFAVLTNYRETVLDDPDHPIQGTRSRGAMVTAWLTADGEETIDEFVVRLLGGEGVKGVGGFSLLCGKLRRRKEEVGMEPLVIISNRSEDSLDVPRIADRRGEAYGLSNTWYSNPDVWPKVRMGKEKVLKVVEEVVAAKLGEEELVQKLWEVLDSDTLPKREGADFEEYIEELRKSIFIPAINGTGATNGVPKADTIIASADPSIVNGNKEGPKPNIMVSSDAKPINGHHTNHVTQSFAKSYPEKRTLPDPSTPTFDGMSGPYGTQRQTIILVDWAGNVKFIERSLFEPNGIAIPRGKGDVSFGFRVDGFES